MEAQFAHPPLDPISSIQANEVRVRFLKCFGLAGRHGRQKGFTLIETLVVMIVGIVILAALAAGISKLFRASEIAEEASNIAQMFVSLKNISTGPNGYKGLRNVTALEYKVIPATMNVEWYEKDGLKTAVIRHTWGGLVVVYPEGAHNEAFRIRYSDVPSDACQQLSLKLRNAGWTEVRVQGIRITSATRLADIAKYCKKDKNDLFFTSLRRATPSFNRQAGLSALEWGR